MTKIKPFRFFISLALVLSHLAAAADDGLSHEPQGESIDRPNNPFTLPHTFRVIVPTTMESHVDGNSGALMLNFESTPIDQLGEMLERARVKGLLPDWRKTPPTIYLYLTPEADEFSRDDLVKSAITAFQETYPGVNPEIIVRPDQTNTTVKALYEVGKKTLDEERARAQDPELIAAIDEQIEILNLTYAEVKSRTQFTAKRSRELKGTIAKLRAGIVGLTRVGTVFPAFFMGLGPATIALTMSVADAGLELFTATWSQRMQKFLSKNPLALKERTFFEGRKFEVKSETINGVVSVAFNTFWNMLLFVVVRATVLSSLQHAAVPGTFDWPLWTALGVNVLYALPVAALNAFFVKGYLQMVDKGVVSSAQIDMALQTNFVPDTANSFANSIKKIGWIRNITTPFLAGVFLAVGYFGAKLKRRTNRIILIHDAINLDSPNSDPRMEQPNIAATMNVANDNRDERFEEVFQKIRELRARRKECELILEGDGSIPTQSPDAA